MTAILPRRAMMRSSWPILGWEAIAIQRLSHILYRAGVPLIPA